MIRLFIPLLAFLTLPNVVHSSHFYIRRVLIVNQESTKESIKLAKYFNDNGVDKYSAYWCPICLNQSELFGKQAYRELNVAIPKRATDNNAYWFAGDDSDSITESTGTISQVAMIPKSVGALTKYSHLLKLQSTPEIEQIIRMALWQSSPMLLMQQL